MKYYGVLALISRVKYTTINEVLTTDSHVRNQFKKREYKLHLSELLYQGWISCGEGGGGGARGRGTRGRGIFHE